MEHEGTGPLIPPGMLLLGHGGVHTLPGCCGGVIMRDMDLCSVYIAMGDTQIIKTDMMYCDCQLCVVNYVTVYNVYVLSLYIICIYCHK